MGNRIKYEKMYNSQFKEDFIENYYNKEDSKKVVANVFYKSALTEQILEKDLCLFTSGEIASVIRSLELTTYSSVRSVGSTIKAYLDWAYENNIKPSNLNVMNTVDDLWYKKLINETNQLFWTKEYILNVVNNIPDYQDKALIMLVFEGVYGKKLSEIRTLKWSNIDRILNCARVFDENGNERKVYLTNETIELVKTAKDNSHYIRLDGKSLNLVDNDYIFRNTTNGRSLADNPISQIQLLNRMSAIAEYINMPKFTPNNIRKSGMLYVYYQKLLEKNNGKLDYNYSNNNVDLTKQELEEAIAEKYDWSLLTLKNKYEFYNTATYKKRFLNIENVLELYK